MPHWCASAIASAMAAPIWATSSIGSGPAASRVSSEPPLTSSITRKAVPSCASKSKIVATPGCERRDSASASRRKRSVVVGVGRGARGEQLDGHFAIEVGVVRAPDLAHPAGAEAVEEAVAAEGGAEGGEAVVHGWLLAAELVDKELVAKATARLMSLKRRAPHRAAAVALTTPAEPRL